MQNYDKKAILKIAKQLILRCSEYTPPKTKKSDLNFDLAQASLAVDKCLERLKP